MEKSKYILFGAPLCGSAIAEGFLQWAKIPYVEKEVEWEQRNEWPAIFGKYNPLCQVPTLILPNREVLTETLAIAIHANGKKSGLISKSRSKNKFWRWAVYLVSNLYPTFNYRDRVTKLVSDPKSQEELKDAIMERRKEMWLNMERECSTPWFLGKEFSAIDVYLAVMTYWTPGREWFEQNCPRIFAISQKFRKTKTFAKIVKKHGMN